MRTWMVAVLLSGAVAARAGPAPLFRIEDPRGDDHGDGSLVFPLRDDLHQGDLDVISLTAWPDPEGTLFEVTFARRVARPDARAIDISGASLASVARLGFYTFNLELYIDQDRVPGSGLTAMLPGRNAEVDPASAWERLVILTPRPRETRSELKRMPNSALMAGLAAAGDGLEARVLFMTHVTVSGSTVRFVVPASFLGGQAQPTWGYVVAVSGADLTRRLDLPALGLGSLAPPERLAILPVMGGPGPERFGGARGPLAPALVDLFVPPGQSQEALLGTASPPVRLPAVVPAGEPAASDDPPGPLLE